MARTSRWLLLAILLVGCDKETDPIQPVDRNFPPEIVNLTYRPERVLADQEVQLICGARDRDADPLGYRWSSTAGEFRGGFQLPIVRWLSPPGEAPSTLLVRVTDQRDTVRAEIEIVPARVLPPDSLGFVNGANLVDLRWQHSADRDVSNWEGYDVFAASRSIASLPADSVGAYRLNGSSFDREQYRVIGVEPGQRTFYHVRSRREYGDVVELSVAGPEIQTAARLDGFGSASLFEIGARPGRGEMGVRIRDGAVLPLDPSSVSEFDVYLGTADPEDREGDLRLKSVSLLAYRSTRWSGRITGIRPLGNDWGIAVAPEDGYAQQAPLEVGTVYAIRTAEGHFAKMRVNELRGSPPERRVEFQWAWQPEPGYPRF
ncbi:MAG: hypothetical protein GF346_05325 [Candidatus Eisenbacteria bacterium]|nr:hypothetical protein [Candidatus Latescibacterota bacterium]MBD3301848.1 hypothetical protein [Candidatus Eisenbacteria bacterium]